MKAHITNCYNAFLNTSTLLQSVWTSGFFWRRLLLGLLDKTQSAREKNERQMPGEKRGTTSATMETQRGAKAPLVSSLSQAFARSAPPSNLPCCFPWRWMGIRGSLWLSKKRHTNERAAQKSLFTLSVSQQITLASCLLKSSVVHHSAAQLSPPFLLQATYYPLYHDLTSTQTSRLSVWVKGERAHWQRLIIKEQVIHHILRMIMM